MRTSKLLIGGFLLLSPIAIAAMAHSYAQAPERLALASSFTAAAPGSPSLKITADPGAGDLVLEVGPIDLPANSDHRQLPALHAAIPADGWIHGLRVEMVDGRGREVPRRTLHHVNLIAPGQRELFSPIMLRIGAAGQETQPVSLPRLLGYHVRRGQEVIVTSMVHNPTGQDYHGVRLRVHLPYTPGTALVRPVSVLPFYMDVMPPASLHSYDLPPGRSSKSWEARPAVDGRIIGLGGHLHRYGTVLRMEDVTDYRVIWEARPTLDAAGEVSGMPLGRFYMKMGVPVSHDHVYRLTAEYDNTTGAMIPGGGMGALAGALIPADPDAWPSVDRNDPQLKLDWHLVHTGNPNGHGGHQHGAAPAGHDAMPGMDHGSMSMDHGSMAGMADGSMAMDHSHSAAPAQKSAEQPAPAHGTADHTRMPGMEHGHER